MTRFTNLLKMGQRDRERCKQIQYSVAQAMMSPKALRRWEVLPVKVWCWRLYSVPVLDVQAFERLMGPCMDVLKRNIGDYEEQLSKIFGKSVSMKDMRWMRAHPWRPCCWSNASATTCVCFVVIHLNAGQFFHNAHLIGHILYTPTE